MKKKALVIGSHVSQSLSPIVFEYWFEKYNINATYSFKEIGLDSFEKDIVSVLEDKELCGFNITIPFKELIMAKANSLDEHSQKIGAVNYFSRTNNGWKGGNTDWVGFYNSVEGMVGKKQRNTAILLGYGGASKAILYALKLLSFEKVKVYNRTKNKILHLEKERGLEIINLLDLKKEIPQSDVVINTTPTNILKNNIDKNLIQDIFSYDVVYKPKETDFLSYFRKEKRIYGISMLINQAIPCFESWFGIKPEADNGLYLILNKKIKK